MAMNVIQALVLRVDRARICMGILLVTVLQALLAKRVKQVITCAVSFLTFYRKRLTLKRRLIETLKTTTTT